MFVLGQVDSALDAYRKAAVVLPAELRCLTLGTIATVIPGSPSSDNRAILEAQRPWAEQCLPTQVAGKLFRSPGAESGRLIRLGYVTAFFDKRNWMKPVWGMLEQHDRSRFEIHVFSDGPAPNPQHGYHEDVRDRFHNVIGLDERGPRSAHRGAGHRLAHRPECVQPPGSPAALRTASRTGPARLVQHVRHLGDGLLRLPGGRHARHTAG